MSGIAGMAERARRRRKLHTPQGGFSCPCGAIHLLPRPALWAGLARSAAAPSPHRTRCAGLRRGPREGATSPRVVAASSISFASACGQSSFIPLRLLFPTATAALGCGGNPMGRKIPRRQSLRGIWERQILHHTAHVGHSGHGGETAEAPPVADTARRFRGSGTIGGHEKWPGIVKPRRWADAMPQFGILQENSPRNIRGEFEKNKGLTSYRPCRA